jgi:hypothetical protein
MMNTIKKGFVEIHALLVANENKKVSSIMDQLLELMESQQRDKNHYEDEHGLWVFCYYHKEWELTSQVEYGKKANTATGLNSMCKVGTNQWTKQQREFKKAKADLLNQVANGELAITDINDKIAELEAEKDRIVSLFDYDHEQALQDVRQAQE